MNENKRESVYFAINQAKNRQKRLKRKLQFIGDKRGNCQNLQ